jgi:chemotaxis protein CheC
MELTPIQEDSLIEFINISFNRAANALSSLTNHRVSVNIPEIGILPIQDLTNNLSHLVGQEVAMINQIFSGPVTGNAVLMISYPEAVRLSHLFSSQQTQSDFLSASDREALTEVGNILLNACLSTLGNILQVHISFTVPRMQIDGVDGLMRSLVVDHTELRHCLVISSTFNLQERTVSGYMVVVMGLASLDRLIQSIDQFVLQIDAD